MILEDNTIIDNYLTGKYHDIHVTDTCFYMPVRITGLGKTERFDEIGTLNAINDAIIDKKFETIDEAKDYLQSQNLSLSNFVRYYTVDRKSETFASEEMLENYKGLPILKGHPTKSDGSTEFLTYSNIDENPIIGHILKAYNKDDQVWGIAKIFDLSMIDNLHQYKSTSPAVGSYDIINQGEVVEYPYTLNHLAFVPQGHWDCKGEKAMEAKTIFIDEKDKTMAEEVKLETDTTEASEKVEETVDTDEKVTEEEANPEITVSTPNVEEVVEDKSNKKEEDLKKEKDDMMVPTLAGADEMSITDEETLVEEKLGDNDKVDEELEEVVSDEVVEDDVERDEVIDSMRKLIDSVGHNFDITMPYIKGRLTPSEVIRQFLSKNTQYVDEKYRGLVENKDASKYVDGYFNAKLYKEAFIDTINYIYQKNESIESHKPRVNGWSHTDKPNVMIDREF